VKQSFWDRPGVELDHASVEASLVNSYQRASFLAASTFHSGDWLFALPISSCGLKLDDEVVRTGEQSDCVWTLIFAFLMCVVVVPRLMPVAFMALSPSMPRAEANDTLHDVARASTSAASRSPRDQEPGTDRSVSDRR